jgi:hypothetical protein
MEKDTGGTAFPLPLGNETVEGNEGMTLRDYFAAKAMQGELASGRASNNLDRIASRSYEIADAMLRAQAQ